jgi:hypothetical protein
MMRLIRTTLALVALALLAHGAGAAAPLPLDGKSFQGSMVEKGKKPITDTFEFGSGQFHSTSCDKFGFGRGDYSVQPDGHFDATTMSSTDGTIEWHGRIEGDRLTGQALWLKPGKEPIRYQVEGTLK